MRSHQSFPTVSQKQKSGYNLFLIAPHRSVPPATPIGIDYATMGRIKDVCRRQQDGERIKSQIDEVYRRFTTKQMINQVEMIRLADLVEK